MSRRLQKERELQVLEADYRQLDAKGQAEAEAMAEVRKDFYQAVLNLVHTCKSWDHKQTAEEQLAILVGVLDDIERQGDWHLTRAAKILAG